MLSFRAIRDTYIQTFSDNLRNLGASLRPEVTTLLQEGRTRELDPFAKKLRNEIHTRITVINPEGVVLADSEKDPGTMENHKKGQRWRRR